MNVKIIETQQASLCNGYKNTELKLLKTNTAIWFNKMCKIKHLEPNYINIKVIAKKSQEDHNKCDQIQDKWRVYSRTVQHTYINKDLLIYAATSPSY
jgi:hypothetical protein